MKIVLLIFMISLYFSIVCSNDEEYYFEDQMESVEKCVRCLNRCRRENQGDDYGCLTVCRTTTYCKIFATIPIDQFQIKCWYFVFTINTQSYNNYYGKSNNHSKYKVLASYSKSISHTINHHLQQHHQQSNTIKVGPPLNGIVVT
ncbi:hypothetical protein PPL_05716 [Heterostelium album PN500]|uniref:Uncharacterized protein n=1 Tax=Heterostelium pallidum (strain ATCC 26659 / Pp 5 / PN500) TaxID=670386 RepID=D3BAY5_HETP5|nr:hypothetical protein PPL_05716 [Heterostelium album PN500]EFA81722.1 hypothetical protein PPL_05716 [Heterostelium album PN500]|eukprot:XP_020433839.1 hypothetical protein PPL_05716 [Heterostelium album PN500]